MKKNLKISIIIPFFNAEKYLKRTINSVLNQNFWNFEILLINDGSTDNSEILVKQLKKNNPQIRYFKTPNYGPGIARNLGISKAKSVYLLFLDADDELAENAIKSLYNCITSTKSDLAIARHKMLLNNGEEIKISNPFKNTILTKNQAIKAFLKDEIIPTSWAKIYKTNIAKKCTFPDLSWKEDDVFIFKYLQQSEKICLSNKIVLKNNCNSDSLTRQKISIKMITDIFKSYVLQESLIPNTFKSLFLEQQIKTLLNLFLILKIDSKKIEANKKELISLLKNKAALLTNAAIKITLKKRIMVLLLNLSNYLGISFVLLLLSIFKKKQIENLKKIKN